MPPANVPSKVLIYVLSTRLSVNRSTDHTVQDQGRYSCYCDLVACSRVFDTSLFSEYAFFFLFFCLFVGFSIVSAVSPGALPLDQWHVDELVQERRNSIANALELRLSCRAVSAGPRGLVTGTTRDTRVAWYRYSAALLTLARITGHTAPANSTSWVGHGRLVNT